MVEFKMNQHANTQSRHYNKMKIHEKMEIYVTIDTFNQSQAKTMVCMKPQKSTKMVSLLLRRYTN